MTGQPLDETMKLDEALQLILDQVDYTAGACRPNEPIGGVLSAKIIELAKTAISQLPKKCFWEYDFFANAFTTECGNEFMFNDEGPKENHFEFCPFCGKQIYEPVETEQEEE